MPLKIIMVKSRSLVCEWSPVVVDLLCYEPFPIRHSEFRIFICEYLLDLSDGSCLADTSIGDSPDWSFIFILLTKRQLSKSKRKGERAINTLCVIICFVSFKARYIDMHKCPRNSYARDRCYAGPYENTKTKKIYIYIYCLLSYHHTTLRKPLV